MINLVYILIISVCLSVQDVAKKFYDSKLNRKDVFTFTTVATLFACLLFIVKNGCNFDYDIRVLPYSIGFAVTYGMAVVFVFNAVKTGPLSLSSLAISYSLLIPTMYGLIVDGDDVGLLFYIGISLLAVSLFLINGISKGGNISLKWILYVLLAFVGNGTASVLLTVQQQAFQQKYTSEFMIVALLLFAGFVFVCSLIYERETGIQSIKKGIAPMVICGCANGTANLFVILGSAVMNKSIIFPLVSGGGIILTWLLSRLIYKEKLTLQQNIALVLGIISVVLLNIQ